MYVDVSAGKLLLSSLKEAVRMARRQSRIFKHMTEAANPEQVKKWSAMVDAWLADNDNPDPYAEPEPGVHHWLTRQLVC